MDPTLGTILKDPSIIGVVLILGLVLLEGVKLVASLLGVKSRSPVSAPSMPQVSQADVATLTAALTALSATVADTAKKVAELREDLQQVADERREGVRQVMRHIEARWDELQNELREVKHNMAGVDSSLQALDRSVKRHG